MAADFTIETDGHAGVLRLQGTLDLYSAQDANRALEKALGNGAKTIDLSGLDKLDTVGALLLRELREKKSITFENFRPEHAALFNLVAKAEVAPPPKYFPMPTWKRFLCHFGEVSVDSYNATFEITAFIGKASVYLVRALTSPKRLRFATIVHHIEETGIYAIPIVALMAFMIAVVTAYQGVVQLRPMGAEHLTVNVVALSVLREMGVLLTAIMMAGRSGSAFTAEIGVMKVREEVDALQVIGMDPFEVLVTPRVIALLITLPLLTFLADVMGLFGGGVMSRLLLDIPFTQFLDRVRHVAHGHDFLVGMIKAPVFAFLIAIVGCMHGMKVEGSAESVGRETTTSVVKSIFLVLVADAMFSIFFNKVGL